MADHSEIEPYRRDNPHQTDYRSYANREYSRGSSNDNRQSQEKYAREDRKFEDQQQPASILRRSQGGYEKEYRASRDEYAPRHYGHSSIPRSDSRSPPKEAWRSNGSQYSPNMPQTHYRKSSSPLRNKENCSPRCASPIHLAQQFPVEDPMERRSLISQLDELKQRLHYDYTKDNQEINEIRREKENEMHHILSKKDALVEESHMRIQALKREIEEEERKAERIRDDNAIMQKSHTMRVVELQNQIENSQNRLEQVKREHEEAVRGQIRQQDDEKKALREDYERLIEQVRQEYQATREELKDILNDRNEQVDQAKNKLGELKQFYAEEMDNLKKEVEYLQDSIQTSKRLNEKQNQEFEIAKKTNKELQKENYSLQKEISSLEKQAKKYEIDNEGLRHKIMRLDKLVYGKSKSPYKKFYN